MNWFLYGNSLRHERVKDEIFLYVIVQEAISGNLTTTISDYLSHLAITHNIFGNIFPNKFSIFERD